MIFFWILNEFFGAEIQSFFLITYLGNLEQDSIEIPFENSGTLKKKIIFFLLSLKVLS